MLKLISGLLGGLLVSCISASLAHAQARTFVSAVGTDANPCSIAAPCRTLQRGIDAVATGGDVLIVDSGGFGANVLITKSVSVLASPGVQARLALTSAGPAMTINGSGISVSISNLGISASAGGTGVSFLAGTALSLTDMDINGNGVASTALVIHEAAGGHLTISNTALRNADLCFLAGLSGTVGRTTVVNSRAENCGYAFDVGNDSSVSIESSVAAGGSSCVYGFSTRIGSNGIMTLDKVVASHCVFGLYAGSNGGLTVSNALLTGNTDAGSTGGGGIGRTYGNNRVFGNTNDVLNGFTAILEQ